MSLDHASGVMITVGFMDNAFRRFFDILESVAGALPTPLVVQKGGLDDHPFLARCQRVSAFLSESEMEGAYRQAELIIAHAGVGSLRMALEHAKRVILVPRSFAYGEHCDDHQMELARAAELRGLATVIYPQDDFSTIKAKIEKARSAKPAGRMEIELPELVREHRYVAVCSIGGHRNELKRIVSELGLEARIVTDQECAETRSGAIEQFPRCKSKMLFPVRIFQAWLMLRKLKGNAVLTTGAGVGAAFATAGWLMGLKVYSIESLTRIDRPSIWFRWARVFSTHSYCHDWARWCRRYPSVIPLAINIAPAS